MMRNIESGLPESLDDRRDRLRAAINELGASFCKIANAYNLDRSEGFFSLREVEAHLKGLPASED